MLVFKRNRWNPYFVGLLIGGLSLFCFAFLHHTIGTTTTFVRFAALFWQFVDSGHLESTIYYKNYLENNSWINWQMAFVVGIFMGSYIASRNLKEDKKPFVPELWQKTQGSSKVKRLFWAFLGGVILLFGARLAGGCTSGHVISGGMQLALSGWLFMGAFFATGLPAAYFIYRKKG